MSDHEYPKPMPAPDVVQELAAGVGGTITECAALPDGSGFAVMSMPLPKDHWLTAEGDNVPPMPLRMGRDEHISISIIPNTPMNQYIGRRVLHLSKQALEEKIQAAARYACRASTMNGKETDFDPDAMVRNFINGLLGYYTDTGLSADPSANPPEAQA